MAPPTLPRRTLMRPSNPRGRTTNSFFLDYCMARDTRSVVRQCTAMYNPYVTTMTATEARAALPALLDLVAAGDEVTITRHGQPVAVVVRPDALRSRRADAALASAGKLRALLVAGRNNSPTAGGLTEARAEELIAEIDDSRNRH
jgi:prevent-host-death family protein